MIDRDEIIKAMVMLKWHGYERGALECRALINGVEVRLDTDHPPQPEQPAWVRALEQQP